jgi:hypothetical protein
MGNHSRYKDLIQGYEASASILTDTESDPYQSQAVSRKTFHVKRMNDDRSNSTTTYRTLVQMRTILGRTLGSYLNFTS